MIAVCVLHGFRCCGCCMHDCEFMDRIGAVAIVIVVRASFCLLDVIHKSLFSCV